MTVSDYGAALRFAVQAGATRLPEFEDLHRGGIVGIVRLVGCVRTSKSRWFTGKFGFVLEDPYPLPFVRCPGQTGFFEPLVF